MIPILSYYSLIPWPNTWPYHLSPYAVLTLWPDNRKQFSALLRSIKISAHLNTHLKCIAMHGFDLDRVNPMSDMPSHWVCTNIRTFPAVQNYSPILQLPLDTCFQRLRCKHVPLNRKARKATHWRGILLQCFALLCFDHLCSVCLFL